MADKIVSKFEPSMSALDNLIKDLEVTLGKKPSRSPFDDLRARAEGKPVKKEQPKEEKKEEAPAKKEKKEKKQKNAPAKKEEPSNLTPELEWFNTCDLRVGKIVECEECPGSDKLFIEKIDLGEGEIREIGSGVRPVVSKEEMLKSDAFVCVFANLKPRKLAHIMS